ncbi:MAG: hypothetical protein MJZ26_13145 [Fibrobacter sp.]|nr:hypothetical protein [Fibrobacter sp.]
MILALLALYLVKSPKVKGWIKVLWRARLLRRWAIGVTAVVAAIVLAYVLHPKTEVSVTNARAIFAEYNRGAILKLDSIGKFMVDSSCSIGNTKSELVYVLPLVVNSYEEIVTKPTTMVLTRLDDTLNLEMRGYKQFKNRGILLTKLLKKKLGNRYDILITSDGSTHTLQVTYSGKPWDTDQLFALPVMEAAKMNKIDPALLMSLIRHVSNFDFDFKGPRDSRGLLLLEEGEGLEQVFLGATRLSKMLQVGISRENAIATFYPDFGIGDKPENWRNMPLAKSWVDQVLEDVQFYRVNGL